ncbi:MAG TPA: hypothetical protein VIU11_19380 [Nakamurella sp.]
MRGSRSGSAFRRRVGAALAVVLGITASIGAVPAAAQAAVVQTEVVTATWSGGDQTGWGSADLGGAFAVRGSADAFAVQGGKGVIRSLQPGKSAGAFLSVAARDVIVQDVVTVPNASPLGLHHTLEARRQSDGTSYRGRVQFGNGGKVTVGVSRTAGSADTGLGSTVLPLTVSAGQEIALQFQVTGTDPVQLSVRAHPKDVSAPDWQFVVNDGSGSRISTSGNTGIWDYVSGASPASTILHDDFRAYSLSESSGGSTGGGSSGSGTVYRSATFDGWSNGAVDPSAFNAALGKTNKNAGAYDDISVVADSRGNGKVLRTTLKAGTIHSQPGGDNGNNLFVQLDTALDQACLSYDIKFDSNFDWSLGGKLPGLEGVAPGVAPAVPTGGGETQLGWSGRAMWLGPKAYRWAGPTNQGVSYMYHPGQAGTYGDNVRWNRAFVAGQWHTVKQCYRMNTVGRADGSLTAWFDGIQVVNDSAFVYRTRGDVRITHLVFSVFRGGGTLDWAGSRDGYIDIDNVKITSS